MRIEDQRVRALHAGQRGAELGEQGEEAAVRGVDVVPHSLALGDVGDGREGIDGAGVGGAGGGEDEPGPESPRAVLGDERGEGVRAQPETVVHRDVAANGLAEAGDAQRLVQAVVQVRRGVHHGALDVAGLESGRLARRDDRDQAGDGSPRCEVPVGRCRVPDDLRHPVEDQVLHLHRSGADEAHAGVLVRHRGEVVGERRRVEAAAGHVAEVAGVVGQERRLHDGLVDAVDELFDGAGPGARVQLSKFGGGRLVGVVCGRVRKFVEEPLRVSVRGPA